jgi:hypothetical protein
MRIGTERYLFMKITENQSGTVMRRMGKVKFLPSEGALPFIDDRFWS